MRKISLAGQVKVKRQGIRDGETSYEATEPPMQGRRDLNLESSRNGYKRLADTERKDFMTHHGDF